MKKKSVFHGRIIYSESMPEGRIQSESAAHSEAVSKLEHKYALAQADILWLHNVARRTTHGWND
ncbi:hypothetical protein EYF80_018934 [Liparis tanakae]|uniref:Uncharacterized protein n=1 Tax=Liparis tanakae TaxID=230148 RepID=A0A4Z2HZ36_9TELE|nr:hypothetical protein EYF80_018934 [Liparis tanakae]